MTQTDKGQFVQFPIHLIYGCPDLNRDDKWVLLAIMGRCWSEGPQRLSYRDIAAISGVPLSLISSFKDKSGKVHEGIVDRLVRLNFLRIIIGKEVNPSTGSVKGQAQSYVYVNYAYIWQMNVAYCNSRKSVQEEFKVTENDFASVSHTNTSNTESVSYTNASVPIGNAPVSNANTSVSHTNKSVSSASTKTDTYITVDTTDNIDEERVAIATAPAEISSQEIDPEKTEERPIVKSPQRENTNAVQQRPPKPRANKVPIPKHQTELGLMDELPASPASKPVEPHAEMTWGTRKCLQWFDYWRGGVLIAKYKLQQAAGCAKGLAEQFDEATVIRIRGDMADDPYYIERGGPDICDVANNIHKYLNKKKPKKEPSNEHKVVSQYSPKALYEKNKWKADAMIAAYEAQEAAKQGAQS